jgi:Rrf2 family transcriptional regulator, nitric oxide-sensitive transcriptional repressor
LQLTLHADYSLRVLLYLAEHPGRVVSTQEMSEAYRISRNHLVRVVQTLHSHSFVKVVAGRKGGVSLTRPPVEIRLGEVVRQTEPGFRLVECFEPETNTCPIVATCLLHGALGKALESFFGVLNQYTLADLARSGRGGALDELLQIEPPRSPKP